ncbi:MAG: metallophosphoesterase [Pseudomonadota bacterium]
MVISKLFGLGKSPAFPPPRPDTPVEIVGDLHGCAHLFDALPAPEPGCPRIFVGDIVDRGPDSRGVVERVRAHEEAGQGTCLMGNHEAMMLGFLDDPVAKGQLWLRNGGLETLLSFGVAPDALRAEGEILLAARDAFREALGPGTEAWLRARPLMWQSGNLVVTHAGADPAAGITDQPARALLWGHPDFTRVPRQDGIWIARGHIIVDAPAAESGRIAVDTGAFATGRLSMARVTPEGEIRFLTVTGA